MVGIPHTYIYVHTPPWSIFLTFLETPAWLNKTSFQMSFFRLKIVRVGKMAMVGYECMGMSGTQCFVYFFNLPSSFIQTYFYSAQYKQRLNL
jgi:hypothetical protein